MAILISFADGNITGSSTFETADTTFVQSTVSTFTIVTTSYVTSPTLTPGAITIDGMLLFLNSRTTSSPTGTFSAALDQGGVTVAGTEVTINVTDIPAGTNDSDIYVFLAFAAPVTLVAATAYGLKVKTSNSSQITIYRSGTTADWVRYLRTTTTASVGSSDTLFIVGEHTGAGATTTRTVTMNNTSSTQFCGVVNISDSGILNWGTTASTNYYLKVAGNHNIYQGGTLNIGTSGTKIPTTSTATLEFVNASNVDCGLNILVGATCNMVADPVVTVPWTYLNADASSSATSLTTAVSTGWKNGHIIAIASTTRTAGQCESKSLTADASGTTLTISALTNAHSGGGGTDGSEVKAELANLSRTIVIKGTSSSLQTFIFMDSATVEMKYVEFVNMGSATTTLRGFTMRTNSQTGSTANYDIQGCAFHDFVVASSQITVDQSPGTMTLTFKNNVMYNITGAIGVSAFFAGSTNATTDIGDLVGILSSSGGGFSLGWSGTNISNINCAGTNSTGITIGGLKASTDVGRTISNLVSHSGSSAGIQFISNILSGTQPFYGNNTASNVLSYRNAYGIATGGAGYKIDGFVIFGNSTANIQVDGVSTTTPLNYVFEDGDVRAGLVLTCPIGIQFSNGNSTPNHIKEVDFINTIFGGSSQTHSTADIVINSGAGNGAVLSTRFDNCILNSSNPLHSLTQSRLARFVTLNQYDNYIAFNWYGQTESFKKYFYQMLWEDDTAIKDSGAQSLRITVNTNTGTTIPPFARTPEYEFTVDPALDATPTINIKVRKSVSGDGTAYTGGQPKLILLRNYGIGITADTVLDTSTAAGDGAFETLTGTCPTLTGKGIAKFVVECYGTAGWINVDSATIT